MHTYSRRHLEAAWLGALLWGVPGLARAGNEEGVLAGNEASMTGGAVTAVVSDGSATWYNPAGLALVERTQIDVSGSATQLRVASTPRLLQSAAGDSVDGGYYELNGIPAHLAVARRLGEGVVVSGGLFVPALVSHTDRVRMDLVDPRGNPTSWQLVQQENSQSYYAGLALGLVLAPNLRFGLAAYGLYRQTMAVSHFFGGSTVDVTGASSLLSLQSVGIELGGGLQWEPLPNLHVGVALRTPAIQLGSRYRNTVTRVTAGPGGIDFEPEDSSGLEPRVQVITATRLRVGIAYAFPRGWVALDADFSHALDLPEFGIRRDWLVNVRVGGRFAVDDHISIGGGLFSDRSATATPHAYGETAMDFYGLSLGLELHTPHALGPDEPADTIVFAQTFSLRYAYGVGRIGGLRFDLAAPEAERVSVLATPTSVHELALYLGSGLHF